MYIYEAQCETGWEGIVNTCRLGGSGGDRVTIGREFISEESPSPLLIIVIITAIAAKAEEVGEKILITYYSSTTLAHHWSKREEARHHHHHHHHHLLLLPPRIHWKRHLSRVAGSCHHYHLDLFRSRVAMGGRVCTC